jgi:hypothetical protein
VIVTCPGCSTHYSHAQEDTPQIGRCSQCDETFALTRPKRRYVVRPAVASAPGDPLLAAGLAETAALVDRPAADLGFPPDFPLDAPAGEEEDGFFGPGMGDDEALFGFEAGPDADAEAQQVDAQDDEAPARRPAHPVREALGVFLLAGLGGAAGFHGSLQFGIEPAKAIGFGLALGLTFGWAWIRWAERRR